MSHPEEDNAAHKSSLSGKLTVIICLIALLVAAGVTFVIFSTEPTAERESATRKSAMLVDTVEVRRDAFRPLIVETGVVMPARDIQLSPQVGGLITEVSPNFVPGGFIRKGETIIQIEEADYTNMLQQSQNELAQAETELKLEMGRQKIAEQDFALLQDSMPEGDTSLVLREPQLAAARIRVDAARSAVEQAQLNLTRTQVKSPFDAQIISRSANLGSQVSTGTPLGHLIGVDTYWVMATVALSKVPYLKFPESSSEKGAPVTLRNRSAWPKDATRTGHLFRLVGALETQTRLARVVIEVPDPLARSESTPDAQPLLVGEYLEVRIEGRPIENVVRLERDYLRKNDTAWVMDEGNQLRIQDLDIIFKDATYAYIREGLEDGDRVVTTNLSTVTDGAELRLEGTESSDE